MRHAILVSLLLAVLAVTAMSADHVETTGLVTLKSNHDVATTADNLVAGIEAKGITVFTRIDHGANAAKVDIELAPMQLVIFGKAQLGTRLMQGGPTVGIDLPLKALVWQDADGQVWLSYNDPAYLVDRHEVKGADEVVVKMQKALAGLTKAATE